MSELYADKKRDLTKLKSKSRTFFPSRKMQDSIVTECPLESSLCYYFEFDRSITSYESQPLSYYYMYEGERHLYTPDFEVFCGEKSFYVEVKSTIEIQKFENFELWFEAVRQQAVKLGKDLILKKEQWIKRSPSYQNNLQLYRCLKVDYSYDFVCQVKSKLVDGQLLPISALIDHHYELSWLYKLIAEQFVELSPPEQLLSLDCMVKWGQHEQSH